MDEDCVLICLLNELAVTFTGRHFNHTVFAVMCSCCYMHIHKFCMELTACAVGGKTFSFSS